MELASILNYVHDSIRHNQEQLDQLKDYCRKNPAKSVQAKKIRGKIYYCIEAYNKKLREIKIKYRDLQARNEKLKRILKLAEKLNNEN
jgi:hypothetical protein